MSDIIFSIASFLNKYTNLSFGVSQSIAITLIVLLSWQIIHLILSKFFISHVGDLSKRYIATKSTTYLLRFIVIVILFDTWIGGGGGIWAYLGLLSAGIAVALQDSLANLAGWVFIMTSKPFSTGDRIEIDEHAGDVIDIRINQTTILEIGKWVDADQSTGRIIHLPNGWFLKKSISNYTQKFNFIWNEIPVMITFESNWEKAREILSEIISEHKTISEEEAKSWIKKAADAYMIYYSKLTPYVWLSVADSGVVLTIRYLCEPRKRRSSSEAIWIDILREFQKHKDIELAYPTQRMYLDPTNQTSMNSLTGISSDNNK